jgi:hypothetical protein
MNLYKYNQFNTNSKLDHIHSICQEYGIENYDIDDDFIVDVAGDVRIKDKLIKIPIKFGLVSGRFSCSMNELSSLENAPISVGSFFNCSHNKLTSLKGSPKSVRSFACADNQLTTLEGITQMKTGNIWCDTNYLVNVKGIKQGWRGKLVINGNPVYEIFKLFPEERFDEVVEYLNEYEVIRDGNKVILQALEMVFEEMVLDVPEIEYIKGYEII